MSAASIVTIIGVGVVAGALVVYLTIIAVLLRNVSFTLGTVLIGVRAIANQTQPVGEVVNGIVEDVNAIQRDLNGLLALAGAREPAAVEEVR